MKGTKGHIWRGIAAVTILSLILGVLPMAPTALGAEGDTRAEARQLWTEGDSISSDSQILGQNDSFWYRISFGATQAVQITLTTTSGDAFFDVYFGLQSTDPIPAPGATNSRSFTLGTGAPEGDYYVRVRSTLVSQYTITVTPQAGGGGGPTPTPTPTVTPGDGSSRQSPIALSVGTVLSGTVAAGGSLWYFLNFDGSQAVDVTLQSGVADLSFEVYKGNNPYQEPGGALTRFYHLSAGSFYAGLYFFKVLSTTGGNFNIGVFPPGQGGGAAGDTRANPLDLAGALPISQTVAAPTVASKWFRYNFTGNSDVQVSVGTPNQGVQLWVYLGNDPSPMASVPGQGSKLATIKQGFPTGTYIFEVRNVSGVGFDIKVAQPLASGACVVNSPCPVAANQPQRGNAASNGVLWFVFNHPGGQRAKVELRTHSPTIFMNIRQGATNAAPTASNVRSYPLGQVAGLWYFEVSGGAVGGDFELEVKTESAGAVLPPGGGDSRANAVGVGIGHFSEGQLAPNSSTWFRFGFFGQPAAITLTTVLTGPLSMKIYYGPSSIPLTTISSTVGSPAGYNLGSTSATGDYFLEVLGGANGGRYNLRIEGAGGPGGGSGSGRSNPIFFNTQGDQKNTYTGQKIWYAFNYATPFQPVDIELEEDGGGQNLVFDVFYQSNPNPIGASRPGSPKQVFTISSPNLGIYYIVVRAAGFFPGPVSFPFTLRASAGGGPGANLPLGDRQNPERLESDHPVSRLLGTNQQYWYYYDIPSGKSVRIKLTQADTGVALNIFGSAPEPIAPGVRSWSPPPFFPEPTVFINVAAPFGGSYTLVAETGTVEAGDGSSREKAIPLPAEVDLQNSVTGAERKWFVYQHSGGTVNFQLKRPGTSDPHPEVAMDIFIGESTFPQPGSGSNFGFVGGGAPPGPVFIVVYRTGGGNTVDFTIRATTQMQFGGPPPPGGGGFQQPSTSLKAGVYDCTDNSKLVPGGRVAVIYGRTVITTVTTVTGTMDLATTGFSDGHYNLRGLPPVGGTDCAPGFTVGVEINGGLVFPAGDPQVGQHLVLGSVQLKGTVKDPNGNPVKKARVKAVPDFGGAAFGAGMGMGGTGSMGVSVAQFGGGFGGPPGGEEETVVVKTDDQGNYRMGGFMPGVPYMIIAYPPLPADGGPGNFAQSEPVKKRFEGGPPPGGGFGPTQQEAQVVDLTLTTPDVLGRVTNPNGDPVPGAKVIAKEEFAATFGPAMGGQPSVVSYEAFTNITGTYRLGGFSSGKTYKLLAKPPETGPNSGYKNSQPKRVSYAGTQLTGIDLALTSAQITVTVTSGGVGVPGARVEVFSIGGFGPGVFYEAKTDSSGKVTFGGLADGLYNVQAFPPPDPKYFKLAPAAPQQTKISSSVASPNSLSFNLGAATLTGVVYKSDGKTPATSGVRVEIFKTDRTFHYGVGVNEQGAFAIGGMPPGTYKIQAKVERGGFGFGEQSQDTDSLAKDVTIDANGEPDASWNGKLVLTSPQLTIFVVDPNNNPPSFPVHIDVFQGDGPPIGEGAETDPSTGQALLGGLKDGTYQLQVFLPPMLPYAAPDPVEIVVQNGSVTKIGGQADTSGRLTLTLVAPKKKITGSVKKNDGTPVTNAGIHAFREDGSGSADTFVNSNGTYELKLPKGGVWLLVVFPMFGGPGGGPGGSKEGVSIKQAQTELDWIFTEPPRRVEFTTGDEVEETISSVDFTVGKAGATVIGRVALQSDPTKAPDLGTTFVDVRDDAGVGNGVPLAADGTFTVAVPAGLTARVRVFSKDATLAQVGEPPLVETKLGVPVDVGTILLSQLTLSINGKVVISGATDANGEPVGVENIEVTAWKQKGLGFARTTSTTGGVFSLPVSPGKWKVMARPGKGSSYTPKGAPVDVTVTDESVSGVTVEVQAADGVITGRLTSTGGVDTSKLFGFGYALDSSGALVAGTPMERGRFQLRVPSGVTYTVGVNFPPGLEYGATPATVDLTSALTATVDIPISVADSNIVGSWVDETGSKVQNLDATVFASGPKGFKRTNLGASGNYNLRVIAGTWFLGGEINVSGYALQPPANNKVVVGAGDTVILDSSQYFTVTRASGKVVGKVTDPDGDGIVARVWAETIPTGGEAPRLVANTLSSASGSYEMAAPAGTYVIRAAVPPEKGFLPPLPVRAEVPATGAVTVDLQFKTAQATVSGNVSGPGASTALVTGYSDKGSWASVTVTTTGTVSYTLNVTQDDVWHIRATSSVSNTIYRSDFITVTVGATDTSITGQDLVLKKVEAINLPNGSSVTFDAASMQVLALDDGTQVTIPAGALATSGNVTVYAIPTEKLTAQPNAQPVGIGYALQAFDSNNAEIKKFLQDVTIKIPYPSDATLATLGIDETKLKPMRYDTTSGSWVVAEPYTQDTENNVFIVTTDHFTIYAGVQGVGATEVGTAEFKIYLPFVSKQYASGW
jgi:hypothetical protein